VVRDYKELVAALRARADELQITRETLDHVAGLQSGYAAKLLAPVPIRRIGRALGPILSAMGLALVVVEDVEVLKRIDSQLTKRNRSRDTNANMPTLKKSKKGTFWTGCSEWGRMMAARRVLMASPTELTNRARNAARSRWARHRARNESNTANTAIVN
jgi:hypothetical protein